MVNEEIDPELVIRRLKQEIRDLKEEIKMLRGENTEAYEKLSLEERRILKEDIMKYCFDKNNEIYFDLKGSINYARQCIIQCILIMINDD